MNNWKKVFAALRPAELTIEDRKAFRRDFYFT